MLAEGDENATHVGTKGEVGLSGIQMTLGTGEPAAAPATKDAWRRWLRDNGIDWDGQVA